MMSYRIIHEGGGAKRAFILDEEVGKIVAEVMSIDGCKPLVALANRAEKRAVEEAQERTKRAGADAVEKAREAADSEIEP
jgi:uncharacterized protein YbjQ (UPF0145 family)